MRSLNFAVTAVEQLVSAHHPTDEVHAAHTADAIDAVHAADAVRFAVLAASRHGAAVSEEDRIATSDVRSAVEQSLAASQPIVDTTPVIRRDFDYLSRLAEGQKWTNDTPVPPDVFGPLWPEGPPKGWPPITDIPPRTDLALEAFVREGVAEQTIQDDIVNLFNALNRYHIARSGVRLTLEQFRSLLPALVPAEA